MSFVEHYYAIRGSAHALAGRNQEEPLAVSDYSVTYKLVTEAILGELFGSKKINLTRNVVGDWEFSVSRRDLSPPVIDMIQRSGNNHYLMTKFVVQDLCNFEPMVKSDVEAVFKSAQFIDYEAPNLIRNDKRLLIQIDRDDKGF